MEQNLYNLNVERAILSSIIYEPSTFDDISLKIKSEDFYLPFHSSVLTAMIELASTDMPIDAEFVRQRLLKDAKFDEEAYLQTLTANPVANIDAYIQELKDYSQKRKIMKLGSALKKAIVDDYLPAADVTELLEQELYKIVSDGANLDFKTSEEALDDTLKYMEEMKSRGDSLLAGLDTGFKDLNEKTAGFGKGDLIIIAARPAMGKTAFALNIASKTLDRGHGVAIFSLEMDASQLMLRMLSAKTSIPLQDLRLANLTDAQWSSLTSAIEHFRKKKLFLDDCGSLNISSLRSKLRKIKSQHPEIELAVIDYLQLMTAVNSKERHLEVSEISRGLKQLARELSMPIIALSQLNRALENRNEKRPMMSDIRESGSIEQDADLILFVYRDDIYRQREEAEKEKKAKSEGKEYKGDFRDKPEEEAEIIIGKNRNGPTGIVKLVFQKHFTRFENAGGFVVEHVYKETKIEDGIIDKIEMVKI